MTFHREGSPPRSSWWTRWQRARALRDLRVLRRARSMAFDHFANEALNALHQPLEHWPRTVGLLADRLNRQSIEPWHWHAVLRRAYTMDHAAVRTCPADWSTCSTQVLWNRRHAPAPTVQRWLWVAVHAHDAWLADRTLNDGARANAFLVLPEKALREGATKTWSRGTFNNAWTVPMGWLNDAQRHGGDVVKGWEERTGAAWVQWPASWKFWWGSVRSVGDASIMLRTLAHPRRGEDLDHRDHPPLDVVHRWQVENEKATLRHEVDSVVTPTGADALLSRDRRRL